MSENTDSFWDFYWEVRLRDMETLGKREAILAGSRLIREMAAGQPASPVRLLELGCGEGQVIGALAEAHAQTAGIDQSVGVDYAKQSIATCRRAYPRLKWIDGDFTDPVLIEGLGSFEILLLVNALHEVFSSTWSAELGEVDVPRARQRVEEALGLACGRIVPGGYLLIFDGLEPPGDPQQPLRVRFLSWQARENFETFAREYHPFKVSYRATADPFCVELTRRDFTRYIDKSIFLGKQLWKTERLESYQYFTEADFRAALARQHLTLRALRTLTMNEEKWSRTVEIETPGVDFPVEHILILAQKVVES
jgi:SAM-dependent methyltransferase